MKRKTAWVWLGLWVWWMLHPYERGLFIVLLCRLVWQVGWARDEFEGRRLLSMARMDALMNRWFRILRGLSLIADQSLANRIIHDERLKAAEARVALYDEESRHICVRVGCRKPVVGKDIFAHCERHLEHWEQNWFRDNAESVGTSDVSRNEADHPNTIAIQELFQTRRQELIKQNEESKFKALANAKALLASERARCEERQAFLPTRLLKRIEKDAQISS